MGALPRKLIDSTPKVSQWSLLSQCLGSVWTLLLKALLLKHYIRFFVVVVKIYGSIIFCNWKDHFPEGFKQQVSCCPVFMNPWDNTWNWNVEENMHVGFWSIWSFGRFNLFRNVLMSSVIIFVIWTTIQLLFLPQLRNTSCTLIWYSSSSLYIVSRFFLSMCT